MCLWYLSSLSGRIDASVDTGVGSDRSLGRPKEWNGEPSGFDDFAFMFSNWLSGLPGDAERFLEESVTMAKPIQWETLTPREKVVARGVVTALRALMIGGKAPSCIRHHPEKLNGFEMWRLLYREYKPDTATRKVGLLERVKDDQPAPGMDFGDWFLRRGKGKSNSGKGKGNWWHEHHDQRWMKPFRGYCGHCWNGVRRRPSALNGRCVVRWNSVQWCHILHRLLFLTICVATCPSSEFFSCLTCLLVGIC